MCWWHWRAEAHPDHASAAAVFEQHLESGEEIALSISVAAEFLHVVTDPKRLSPPLEMTDAVRWLREWNSEVTPLWVAPDEKARKCWLRWMTEFQLGRKRILDTQYAALLFNHGVTRLLTKNAADFRVFNVFEIVAY